MALRHEAIRETFTMPEIKRDGGDGVVLGVIGFLDRYGRITEGNVQSKITEVLVAAKQWKYRHKTSMLAVRAAFSCLFIQETFWHLYF